MRGLGSPSIDVTYLFRGGLAGRTSEIFYCILPRSIILFPDHINSGNHDTIMYNNDRNRDRKDNLERGGKVRARLIFRMPDKRAEVLSRALQVECRDSVPGTSVRVELEEGREGREGKERCGGGRITIDILADRTSALRACINSYLSWVMLMTDMLKNTEGDGEAG